MRVLVIVVVCRGNIGRLSKGFRGRRQPLDSARYKASADVAKHRLGLLWSCRPVLEGARVVAVLPRVAAMLFTKGNKGAHAKTRAFSSSIFAVGRSLYSGQRRGML